MQIAKLRPKRIYLNRLEQLEKYGDNIRRTVLVLCPSGLQPSHVCSAVWPRLPAGDRAGCWVPRQLSDPLARLGYRS